MSDTAAMHGTNLDSVERGGVGRNTFRALLEACCTKHTFNVCRRARIETATTTAPSSPATSAAAASSPKAHVDVCGVVSTTQRTFPSHAVKCAPFSRPGSADRHSAAGQATPVLPCPKPPTHRTCWQSLRPERRGKRRRTFHRDRRSLSILRFVLRGMVDLVLLDVDCSRVPVQIHYRHSP